MPGYDVPEDERTEDVDEECGPEQVESRRIDEVDDGGTCDGTNRTTARYREPSSAGDRRREAQSVGHGER